MLHSWGTWATRSNRARSKCNFVRCHLTNGFGISRRREVHVYHKMFSFLSSAVLQARSFSGCRLHSRCFCGPVLAPLLATELLCPKVTPCPCCITHGPVFAFCCLLLSSACAAAVFCACWWEWELALQHLWPGQVAAWVLLSSQTLVARACGCWPVSPARGELAATLIGLYLCFAQKLDTKKPTQKQFFSPRWLLIPKIFFPRCVSWYYLLLLWEPLSVLSTVRITLACQWLLAFPSGSDRCAGQEGRDAGHGERCGAVLTPRFLPINEPAC